MPTILSNILSQIGLRSFVALDLETTGLDPQRERIIEIGAVRFVDGAEKDKFTSFVYPRKPLPDDIVHLTGITDDDLKEAPYAEEALPEFRQFIGEDPLAAHNAPFDFTFLKVEFARIGDTFHIHQDVGSIGFDTAVLARALLPNLESHSLSRLAEHFRIGGGKQHRAEDDARRCGLLLLRLLESMTERCISEIVNAAKIMGPSALGYMFQALSEYQSRIGAPVECKPGDGYSRNFISSVSGIEEVEISDETLENIFNSQGVLANAFPAYELRPRQLQMAQHCRQALSAEKKFLMAEAGTGTGKSFAYLIPTILFSAAEKIRVVVSTNTKNLQEQLFNKDLPFLADKLPLKFSAALLKGRANYLCMRKWAEILTDPDSQLADEERTYALSLLFWSNRTSTGDIAENSGFRADKWYWLWNKVASEAGACAGQKCAFYDKCFLQKARQQALKSNIVVVNHALVLTDISANKAVLGEYQHLIIDEAHNFEKAASIHLGKDLNIWKIRSLCARLHRKDQVETGITARLKAAKIEVDGAPADFRDIAVVNIYTILSEAGEFFANVTEAARFSGDKNSDAYYTIKKRYGPKDEIIKAGESALIGLLTALNDLYNNIQRYLEKIQDDYDIDIESESPILELSGIANDIYQIREDLKELTTADNPDLVFWWELPKNDGPEIQLCAAPLSPAKVLQAQLYPWLNSVIFTSATLTVGGKFDYFMDRLGLNQLEDTEVICHDYGTSFDYQRQAVFGAPVFLPNPKNRLEFDEQLAKLIEDVAIQFKCGILALFTSYQQLNHIYNMIHSSLSKEGVPVLAQGIEGSRSDIMARFLSKRAVLLGTDSFWEGIDAPGDALRLLIIAKLPFAVPSEPLIEARIEQIENEGRNAFLEYTVPEAAIKLRQGVGRLIRSSTDDGVVLICDNRVVNSRWGEIFRNSLPAPMQTFKSKNEMMDAVCQIISPFQKAAVDSF